MWNMTSDMTRRSSEIGLIANCSVFGRGETARRHPSSLPSFVFKTRKLCITKWTLLPSLSLGALPLSDLGAAGRFKPRDDNFVTSRIFQFARVVAFTKVLILNSHYLHKPIYLI